jgi:hypothetical protein
VLSRVILQPLRGDRLKLLEVQGVALTAVGALHVRVSVEQGTTLDRDVRDGIVRTSFWENCTVRAWSGWRPPARSRQRLGAVRVVDLAGVPRRMSTGTLLGRPLTMALVHGVLIDIGRTRS